MWNVKVNKKLHNGADANIENNVAQAQFWTLQEKITGTSFSLGTQQLHYQSRETVPLKDWVR